MCENMDNTHARRFDDTVRRRAGEARRHHDAARLSTRLRVVVDGIDLDDRHRFRLCEIGLAPGAGLQVMQRSAFGGRVVAFGNRTCRGGRRHPRAVRYGSRGMNMRKTTLRNAKRNGNMREMLNLPEPEGRRLLPFAEWLLPGIALSCQQTRE